MSVAITLTPGSSPGQALVLAHRGFFAQLDVGALKRLFRCQVPVCTAPWMDVPSAEAPACAGIQGAVQRSHRGRGDEEVLPEDSFCVGWTVAHAAGEVFQMAF